MNSRAFFGLVRKMRAYQKVYAKHRRKSDLQTLRSLEDAVDAEIMRVEHLVPMEDPIPRHPTMFG